MIVKHRPQDAGMPTEYTMALDRAEFILLHELVKLKTHELEPLSQTEGRVVSFFALLRAMDHDMQSASVDPIPLPETLRNIEMFPSHQEPSEGPRPAPKKRAKKKKIHDTSTDDYWSNS